MHPIIKDDIETIARAIREEARALEGKTLVISGGCGFLGSYFLGTFAALNKTFAKPLRVIAIDNYITASRKSFLGDLNDPSIRIIEGDITKPLAIDGPVDYVIHAAGLASPVYYQKHPLETIDAAISGAKNLLELARAKQAKSFLFFSSSEIYGDPDPAFIPTPETYKGNVSCTGPRSCYDESKRLAETICMTYHRLHNVPVKIVRPFNVYGPGMNPNDYRVIPTFVTKGIAGETLPVHEKGTQTRTFCYISDAVTGFIKVLLSDKNGEAFNVGMDKEEIDMATLARFTSDLMGTNTRAELVNYPPSYPGDEPRRRCPDLTKIRALLGYDPDINLKTGLVRTIAWYRDVLTPATSEV